MQNSANETRMVNCESETAMCSSCRNLENFIDVERLRTTYTSCGNDVDNLSQNTFTDLKMMTQFITFVLALLCLALVLYFIWKKQRYWKNLGVPSIKPKFLFGNTLQRLGISVPFYQFLDSAYYDNNGKEFCGYYDFLTPGLFVSNPDLLKLMLVRDFTHFSERREFKLAKVSPIANEMLTNASRENWREIRTVVSPTFTISKVKTIFSLVEQKVLVLMANLKNMKNSKGCDSCCLSTVKMCEKYMIDSIASCAFGIESNSDRSEGHKFSETAADLIKLSWKRIAKIILLLSLPWMTDILGKFGVDLSSSEFNYFKNVINHTRKCRKSSNTRRGDFLDLLEDTKLSDDRIVAQSVLFLLAGYANTSTTLAVMIHLLAAHPHEQAALRREIYRKRKETSDLSYDDIRKLPYLKAVMDETLRLYPGGPVIERVCTRDYSIPGTDINLQEGQPILVPVWSIHRDPAYWPQSLEFKPSRFLPHRIDQIRKFTYLPFGVGPRSCVGFRFADMAIKTAIVEIITKYDLSLCDNHSVHPLPLQSKSLTLKPANKCPIKFDAIPNPGDHHLRQLEIYPPSEDELICCH